MTVRGPHPGFKWVTCACGKRAYFTRAEAKRAMKVKHPHDNQMSTYECTRAPVDGHFHFGHTQPGDRDRGRKEQA